MSRIYDALRRAADAPETPELPAAAVAILRPETLPVQTAAPAAEAKAVPVAEAAPAAEAKPSTLPYRAVTLEWRGAALPFQDSNGYASEQYRMIRTRLLHHDKKPRVIAVSSPASGDGKTVSAINIAAALSLNKRVILLDGDFRCSKIHTSLGLEESTGLAEVLAGKAKLEEAVAHSEQFPDLFLVLAGIETGSAAELFGSPAWHELIERLRREFDYVIVDTPPIGAVADYELIQREMDGIVFIVRPDRTKKAACTAAFSIVPKEKMLGVVVNCATRWPFWRNTYGYGYAEYSRYQSGRRDTK